MKDKIQAIRDLMRPFLTVWFSVSFISFVFYGAYTGSLDYKEAARVVEILTTAVVTYHFTKSTKRDVN